jgi:hypothetical protein
MSDYAKVSGIDIPHKELDSCRGFLDSPVTSMDERLRQGQRHRHSSKELDSCRGFLVYYLKGVHHMLDSWRPGRDADG